jgi:predicted GTPase
MPKLFVNNMVRKAIIIGAAGRDFHNFNTYFRENPNYKVVAFTAAQIPYIENRTYPKELSGKMYPEGIPIYSEEKLTELISQHQIDEVFFSYSDVSYENIMHLASKAIAAGASFSLLSPKDTQLNSNKPVISVLATRTGAGKSTISRMIVDSARDVGLKPAVVRHPMPYGDLRVAVQHFKSYDDFKRYDITIEEEEEYSDHIDSGVDVFAGVDYNQILEQVEKLCDVIIWDGGNNDFSFYKSDCTIVVADPLREGHETLYHPSEVNVRIADAVVINKVNAASAEMVEKTVDSCKKLNPNVRIYKVNSEVTVDFPNLVKDKKVLVVEDGPSVTHGQLQEGAGAFAAKKLNCQLVDPKQSAVGSIKTAYEKFPWLGPVMPALGYSHEQLQELQNSINQVNCDAVLIGTPADLRKRIKIDKPAAKVLFKGEDAGIPKFTWFLHEVLTNLKKL